MFRITRRRATTAAAAALVSIIALAGPASASGSFTWSADFANSLTSREWTAGSGTTTISEKFSCNGANGRAYYINFQHKSGSSWKTIGSDTDVCGFSNSRSFYSSSSGKFRFVLIAKDTDGGKHFSGNGKTTYP
jgi:hypothetical protein